VIKDGFVIAIRKCWGEVETL